MLSILLLKSKCCSSSNIQRPYHSVRVPVVYTLNHAGETKFSSSPLTSLGHLMTQLPVWLACRSAMSCNCLGILSLSPILLNLFRLVQTLHRWITNIIEMFTCTFICCTVGLSFLKSTYLHFHNWHLTPDTLWNSLCIVHPLCIVTIGTTPISASLLPTKVNISRHHYSHNRVN